MEQLIRLQNIDTKLKDLNDLLGDLPSKVEDLNRKEESVKNSIIDISTSNRRLDGRPIYKYLFSTEEWWKKESGKYQSKYKYKY